MLETNREEILSAIDNLFEMQPLDMPAIKGCLWSLVKINCILDVVTYCNKLIELHSNQWKFRHPDPDSDLYWLKADALIELQDFEGALEASTAAIATNPHDRHAYRSHAQVLFKSGKYDEAMYAFEAAFRLGYKDLVSRLFCGRQRVNLYEKAKETSQNLFEASQKLRIGFNREVLLDQESLQKALEHFKVLSEEGDFEQKQEANDIYSQLSMEQEMIMEQLRINDRRYVQVQRVARARPNQRRMRFDLSTVSNTTPVPAGGFARASTENRRERRRIDSSELPLRRPGGWNVGRSGVPTTTTVSTSSPPPIPELVPTCPEVYAESTRGINVFGVFNTPATSDGSPPPFRMPWCEKLIPQVGSSTTQTRKTKAGRSAFWVFNEQSTSSQSPDYLVDSGDSPLRASRLPLYSSSVV